MTKLIRTKDAPPMIPFVSRICKKLGNDTGRFGLFHIGNYEYGSENEIGFDFHGVYKMQHCKEGYIPVKTKFRVTNKKTITPAYIASQNKFAGAIPAWRALTAEQKAVYNNRAKRKLMYGYNLFIKEYMLS
ncbi:MAG: hypothetical protein WC349_05275 [Patescibacteria group bacterium]|jgi:hypothetical protein